MNKKQLIDSIFYPRKSHIPKEDNDHVIKMNDGEKIGARFFLKDKKIPTILFFHGNAELAQEYDDIAEYYNSFDLNFIVSDYRGYGLSTGFPNKQNLHDDSKTVFKYVKEYLNNNQYSGKIFIMGRSLGSASACEIINNFKDDISGCIIESGFATEYPLLNLLNVDPEEIDFSLEDGFMNLEKIKKYNGKLLIIHADLDDIIPYSQAELMLLESSSKNKDFYRVSGANHNNIIFIAREEYFKKIKKFILSND
tara:strand:+ start:39128 stop:39883 length:756 start_codon:yes stop_codon:yes gene_type:complete